MNLNKIKLNISKKKKTPQEIINEENIKLQKELKEIKNKYDHKIEIIKIG